MASLKHIKDHIKAIKNIQKVTNSMKMVSGSKFIRAERTLINAKPLGMSILHFYELNKIEVDLKLFKTHLFPVTSDRGLCGSFPTKICKHTRLLISEIVSECCVVCLGEKSRFNFAFDLEHLMCLVINGIGHRIPNFVDASAIANYILTDKDFIHGRIIYASYVTIVNYIISELPIYSPPILQGTKELSKYENEDEILHGYIEFSTAVIFYYVLVDTYTVELAARMNAMSSATKNAASLAKRLSTQYNRIRQASVTKDLIDIISSAQVVSSK